MEDSGEEGVYLVVNNIPAEFRSADLRNYFSQFIESGGFLCFHYRHRPEVRREREENQRQNQEHQEKAQELQEDQERVQEHQGKAQELQEVRESVQELQEDRESVQEDQERVEQGQDGAGSSKAAPRAGSCCCVVWVKTAEVERLVKMYSGNQWINSKGDWLTKCCVLHRIRVSDQTGEGHCLSGAGKCVKEREVCACVSKRDRRRE